MSIQQFEDVIKMNEKYAHAVFFTPLGNANQRRYVEDRDSLKYSETINNVLFFADCIVSQSCRHVYHYQHYTLNNVACNKTKFINMLNAISNVAKISKKDKTRFNIH